MCEKYLIYTYISIYTYVRTYTHTHTHSLILRLFEKSLQKIVGSLNFPNVSMYKNIFFLNYVFYYLMMVYKNET
jgi:hypothetical protein